MIPAILDCDPGLDDVMAILLGARVLDLRGITTVHGNAPLTATTRNARQILELAGLTDVPLAAGMARPLLRTPHHALEIHGDSGLGGVDLPEPTMPLHPLHAVDFIIAESQRTPGLYLVPVGPLTNIAAALLKDPTLPQRIAAICLMGGSTGIGNTTPAAEFNIYCDAEAAHIVFSSGIPIRMVGLNITRQVPATADRRAQVRQIGGRTAAAAAAMLDFFSDQVLRVFGLPGGAMHDPLAVATLVNPAIVTFQPMHVAVELRGEHTYGMTVCDARRVRVEHLGGAGESVHAGPTPNAEVATAVDPDAFWDLFLDTIRTYA